MTEPAHKIIDGLDRFREGNINYEVTVNIRITPSFLWAIARTLFKGARYRRTPILAYTHIFTNNPMRFHQGEKE